MLILFGERARLGRCQRRLAVEPDGRGRSIYYKTLSNLPDDRCEAHRGTGGAPVLPIPTGSVITSGAVNGTLASDTDVARRWGQGNWSILRFCHVFTCTTFAGGKPLNHVAEALL